MKSKLIIIGILLFSLAACSKDDNSATTTPTPTPPQPDKMKLISAKPWKYFAWTVSPGLKDSAGNTFTNYLANLAPCMRDDIFVFEANTNLTIDQGPTKCDPNDDQTNIGLWFFVNNQTAVKMNNVTYGLAMISADSMRWNFNDVQGATTHTHTITFVH